MKKLYTTGLLTISLLLASGAAKADQHHYDHHNGGHEWHDNDHHDHPVIVPENRQVIHDYYIHNRSFLRYPRGFARSSHRYVHPVVYRRFIVGSYLPEYVYEEPFPQEIILQPAPYGTRYVYYNNDVYLINDVNRLILDAMFYPR